MPLRASPKMLRLKVSHPLFASAIVVANFLSAITPGDACAQSGRAGEVRSELGGGFHLAYGLGAAPNAAGIKSGFRHHLDVAAAIGPGKQRPGLGNSITGDISPIYGPLFGASGLWGLGPSPSYLLAEAGYGSSTGYTAYGGFLGFGSRVSPTTSPVLALRVNVDVLLVNLGLRVVTSLERDPDVLLAVVLGLGQY